MLLQIAKKKIHLIGKWAKITKLFWAVDPAHGFPGGSVVKNLLTMEETRVQSLSCEEPLEEGTAVHSSILAWRIPWTEESSRLQSIRSHRVGHD